MTQTFFRQTGKTDQTGRMARLIWVFTVSTGHFACFDVFHLSLFTQTLLSILALGKLCSDCFLLVFICLTKDCFCKQLIRICMNPKKNNILVGLSNFQTWLSKCILQFWVLSFRFDTQNSYHNSKQIIPILGDHYMQFCFWCYYRVWNAVLVYIWNVSYLSDEKT